MSRIVQPSSFSASKLSIGLPKALDSGGKYAGLEYDGDRSLTLQTPSLQSPFGLNINDKNGPPKYDIQLALRGYEDHPKVKPFFAALSALDEYMVDYATKNSQALFKSKMSREVVQAFYTPTVRFGKDKEGNPTPYPPNIKVAFKRNRDNGNFDCEFYDEKSARDPNAKPIKGVPIEEMLVKKVEVTAIIRCTGVWFAGGKFGLSWKAVQMRLDKIPQGIRGYAFVDEGAEGSDEEAFNSGGRPAFAEPSEFGSKPARAPPAESEDEEEDAPAPAPAAAAPAASAGAEESEEEVAPPPVPKKVTKPIKKAVPAAGKK